MFRDLTANEIDVRVATVNDNGATLLLYKNARVDMDILDETVGALGWKREHTRDNQNCIVSLWDDSKHCWISKEDTGTESFTEKEKGLASDSFKRACFNWGIGRELYTSPFIWVKADKLKMVQKNGKKTTYDKFSVKEIVIENKQIVKLVIINEDGTIVYQWTQAKKQQAPTKQQPITQEQMGKISKATNINFEGLLNSFGIDSIKELTSEQAERIIRSKGL